MATKDEALKMAVKFMETLTIDVGIKTWNEKHRKEAIQACKEVLEYPAQEAQQEPLASLVFYDDGSIEALSHDGTISRLMTEEQRKWHNPIPLYTHPAPSWVGLSDDEDDAIIQSIWIWGNDFPYDKYRVCIEQALRFKNAIS